MARRIAAIADAKMAEDIVALDVGELLGYTDVLVICTARNERQAKAVHDEVQIRLSTGRPVPRGSKGCPRRAGSSRYLDCILHIFVPETRERYGSTSSVGGRADRSRARRRGRRVGGPAQAW